MSNEQMRETWRSAPCPAWCNGHHDDDHPEDRAHHSSPTQVPVIFAHRDQEAGPGRWAMEEGEVSIITSQHVGSDDVVVFIGREDRVGEPLNLTPESAARLARSIDRHLDVL